MELRNNGPAFVQGFFRLGLMKVGLLLCMLPICEWWMNKLIKDSIESFGETVEGMTCFLLVIPSPLSKIYRLWELRVHLKS